MLEPALLVALKALTFYTMVDPEYFSLKNIQDDETLCVFKDFDLSQVDPATSAEN